MIRNSKNSKGFTFLETIVVMILLGIVTVYAMSRTRPDRTALMVQQDILASKIRYAQFMALAGNSDLKWSIRFQRASVPHAYQLVRISGSDATVMTFPDDGKPAHVLTNGVMIKSISPSIPEDLLTFDQWGSPGSDNIMIVLEKNGMEASLSVSRNTGFIQ